MNKGGFLATLLLCSCAASPDRPVAMGVDAPVPMSPVIRGEGIEVRHLRGEATIEEVHVALQAASGRRLTNDFMLAQGYEVHAIDLSIMDPFSRRHATDHDSECRVVGHARDLARSRVGRRWAVACSNVATPHRVGATGGGGIGCPAIRQPRRTGSQ